MRKEQQAWPHTVFVELEDPDGERFEAEIRVSSVTQAEATEKVRDLLERLDTVEPQSGDRRDSTPAEVFSGAFAERRPVGPGVRATYWPSTLRTRRFGRRPSNSV